MFDELELYTKWGFKGTGMEKIAKKYEIKLIDFNTGVFHGLDLEGAKVQVSRIQKIDFYLCRFTFRECLKNVRNGPVPTLDPDPDWKMQLGIGPHPYPKSNIPVAHQSRSARSKHHLAMFSA